MTKPSASAWCECVEARPSIQAVLSSARQHAVCTASGCFASDAEAFGVLPTTVRTTGETLDGTTLLLFLFLMTGLRRLPLLKTVFK